MTRSNTELMAERKRQMVPTFYGDPVHVVKSDGIWLWDAEGRKLCCHVNDGYKKDPISILSCHLHGRVPDVKGFPSVVSDS